MNSSVDVANTLLTALRGNPNEIVESLRDPAVITELRRHGITISTGSERKPQAGGETFSALFINLVQSWPILVSGFAVATLILARVLYGVSLLQPLEELAHRQNEYRKAEAEEQFRDRMIERHLALGDDYMNLGQLAAAKIEYERALSLNPHSTEASFGLLKADVFEPVLAGGFDPEIFDRRISMILREHENDSHAIAFLGDVYRLLDMEKAKELYRQAISVNPKFVYAYASLATILDESGGNPEEVMSLYKTALELSPWNQSVINNMAYMLLKNGDYAGAVERYQLLLSLNGSLLLPYYTFSSAAVLTGDAKYSLSLRKNLLRMLDDPSVANLSVNTGGWFFHTPKGPVYFWRIEDRKYYAKMLYAISLCLTESSATAAEAVREARALGVDGDQRTAIDSLLGHDIAEIVRVQPSFRGAVEQFAKIWKEPQGATTSGPGTGS